MSSLQNVYMQPKPTAQNINKNKGFRLFPIQTECGGVARIIFVPFSVVLNNYINLDEERQQLVVTSKMYINLGVPSAFLRYLHLPTILSAKMFVNKTFC